MYQARLRRLTSGHEKSKEIDATLTGAVEAVAVVARTEGEGTIEVEARTRGVVMAIRDELWGETSISKWAPSQRSAVSLLIGRDAFGCSTSSSHD